MDSLVLGMLLGAAAVIVAQTLAWAFWEKLGGDWLLVAIGMWMLERWRKARAVLLWFALAHNMMRTVALQATTAQAGG